MDKSYSIILSATKQVRKLHSFVTLIHSSRSYKIKKYVIYRIIHMQMNYKRKQESYKHKIKDGGYSRKERNVVRKNVLV